MTLKNNELVTLSEWHNYFSTACVYLPLIQRNYKWPDVSPEDKPEIHSAQQFIESLWDAFIAFMKSRQIDNYYTIGMLTLYLEKEGALEVKSLKTNVQLVDGQQRIITLKLIFKILSPNANYLPISFERDIKLPFKHSRQYYLENLLDDPNTDIIQNTDMVRFSKNYSAIKKYLYEQPEFDVNKEIFLEYLLTHVKILFHCTEVEPFDEFLNINKNKTRFTISDHIKAQLMFDSESDRESILELFTSLSKSLFIDDLYEGISLGYISDYQINRNSQLVYPDENRLKVLFVDRYKGNSRKDYQKDQELQHLEHYNTFLLQLTEDAQSHQKNQLKGYMCFYYLNNKNMRYFKLLDCHQEYSFEEILLQQIETMSNVKRQCFIESQLSGQIAFAELIKNIKNKQSSFWVAMDDTLWENFKVDYKTYIDNKYSEVVL